MSLVSGGLERPTLNVPSVWRRYIRPLLFYGLLLALSFCFLFPFYVVIRNAFMLQNQITSFSWSWLPNPVSLQGWEDMLSSDMSSVASVGLGLRNSFIVATSVLIGQMLVCSMAGFALARIPYRWSKAVFFFILLTLMIPGSVSDVTRYVLVANLGWVNTPQGLVVPLLFNAFTTFLFRQFYLDFPRELEEAGRVDGLGYGGLYWRLILPNSRGILAALGALAFINSWNDFLWPLLIGQTSDWWTVQVVLATFVTSQTVNLPALFMAVLVTILPLFVLFLIAQRYIAEGTKLSGITG